MKKIGLIVWLMMLWVATAFAYEVRIEVQECLVTPGTGSNRTNEIVTVGIPVPESWNVADVSQLGLVGVSVAQLRKLDSWPNGNVKWVLADTLLDVPANGTNEFILTTESVNSAGVMLAVDNGDVININTGVASFEIKKQNFNIFNSVVINGQQRVLPESGRGVYAVDMNDILYTSKNDANSVVTIQENGPVRTCIKAMGKVSSQDGWLFEYTLRMHFVKDSSKVRVQSTMRNASKDKPEHINFKEYGLSVGLADFDKVTLSKHDDPFFITQDVESSDSISCFQAFTQEVRYYPSGTVPTGWGNWLWGADIPVQGEVGNWSWKYTGYEITKNGTLQTAGPGSNNNVAYIDARSSLGGGCTAGVHWFASRWPISYQTVGTNEMRLCLYAPEVKESYPARLTHTKADADAPLYGYLFRWGMHKTEEVMFSFYANENNPADDMTKFQHKLIAKAPVDHYNEIAAGIFPFPPIYPRSYEKWYADQLGWRINSSVANRSAGLTVYKYYPWGQAGAENQTCWSRAHMLGWLQCDDDRIAAGRDYFQSVNRMNFNVDTAVFHSDDYDASVAPTYGLYEWMHNSMYHAAWCTSKWNYSVPWNGVLFDPEHLHWYGIPFLYYVTGDERFKEGVDEFIEVLTRKTLKVNYSEPTKTAYILKAAKRVFCWELYAEMGAYEWTKNPWWLTRAIPLFDSLYNSTCDYDCDGNVDVDCPNIFIDWDGCEHFPGFKDKGFVGGNAGWFGGVCPGPCTEWVGLKPFMDMYILYGGLLNFHQKLPNDSEYDVWRDKSLEVLNLMSEGLLEIGYENTDPWKFYIPYGYNLENPAYADRTGIASYTKYESTEWSQYPLTFKLNRNEDPDGRFIDMALKMWKTNLIYSGGVNTVDYPTFQWLGHEIKKLGVVADPPPPEAAPLGKAKIDIVNDRWFDTRSLKLFGDSAIGVMGAMAEEDKAVAVWRASLWSTYSETAGDIVWQEPNYGISYGVDPMKTLNVYGVGHCDLLSRLMQMTYTASTGNASRKYYHMGHTMAEVDYQDIDGVIRSHIFDCSQKWFVYDRSEGHIATAKDLMNNFSLVLRPSRTPIPKVINDSNVLSGWWSRRESDPIVDPTHSIQKVVRAGEKVTLMFGNDGKPYQDVYANFQPHTDSFHGPYTIDYGNGIWEYTPGYVGEETIYTMSFPYIVSDVVVEQGGDTIVEVSTDGINWVTDFTTVKGWYTFKVRMSGENENPNLIIKTWTQHNIFSLPQLWPGRNRITVSGTVDSNVTTVITYNWIDNGGAKTNVTEVQSTPYTYEILTDGDVWQNVVCQNVTIETVPLIGSGNRTVAKEVTPSQISTWTMAEELATTAMIGTAYPESLQPVDVYVTRLQDAITAQAGHATNSQECKAQSDSVREALAGLMVHGPDAVSRIDEIITAVKVDRSNALNKAFGVQCIYKILGGSINLNDFIYFHPSVDWGTDEGNGFSKIAYSRSAVQCAAVLWDLNNPVKWAPYSTHVDSLKNPEYIDGLLGTVESNIPMASTYKWDDFRFGYINAYDNFGGVVPPSVVPPVLKTFIVR